MRRSGMCKPLVKSSPGHLRVLRLHGRAIYVSSCAHKMVVMYCSSRAFGVAILGRVTLAVEGVGVSEPGRVLRSLRGPVRANSW